MFCSGKEINEERSKGIKDMKDERYIVVNVKRHQQPFEQMFYFSGSLIRYKLNQ